MKKMTPSKSSKTIPAKTTMSMQAPKMPKTPKAMTKMMTSRMKGSKKSK